MQWTECKGTYKKPVAGKNVLVTLKIGRWHIVTSAYWANKTQNWRLVGGSNAERDGIKVVAWREYPQPFVPDQMEMDL